MVHTIAILSVVKFPEQAHSQKHQAEDEAVAKAGRGKERVAVVEGHGGRSEMNRRKKVKTTLNSSHCSKKQ